jgi:acyl carrier protein
MLTIKEKLEEITSEYTDMPTQEFYQASSFADLDIDSLAIVEIIFDIEEAFDITIPAESELESEGYTFDSFVGVLNIVTELVNKESSHD